MFTALFNTEDHGAITLVIYQYLDGSFVLEFKLIIVVLARMSKVKMIMLFIQKRLNNQLIFKLKPINDTICKSQLKL